MSDEFWAAIVGAIVGAVVGGIISFVLQRSGFKDAKEQRETDRKRRQQTTSYSLMIKVGYIYSEAKHMLECIDKQLSDGKLRERPWQLVRPFGNFPEQAAFSVDEMTLLLELEAVETLNKLMMLDKRFNSSVETARLFSQLSKDFSNQLPLRVEDDKASFAISAEQRPVLEVRMAEIDSTISQLREGLEKDIQESGEVLDGIGPLFKEKLELKYASVLKGK